MRRKAVIFGLAAILSLPALAADTIHLSIDASKPGPRIANSFEVYSGTHTSAVADRFQNHVMPFFSKNLCFTAECR